MLMSVNCYFVMDMVFVLMKLVDIYVNVIRGLVVKIVKKILMNVVLIYVIIMLYVLMV